MKQLAAFLYSRERKLVKENMEAVCKQLLASKQKLEAMRRKLTERENHMVRFNF
jgi:hypothetical protein